MTFDFQRFFEQHSIEYVTSGPNVARGNIYIQCPWCRHEDPSHHLGVNLTTGAWGCWRRSEHRGRRPHRLIMAVIVCSYSEAQSIVGVDDGPGVSDFDKYVAKLKCVERESEDKDRLLDFPKSFKPVSESAYSLAPFNYLRRRGFSKADIPKLVNLYDLRYSLVGKWKHRIIVPIVFEERLVNWTARSIFDRVQMRYKTLSHKQDRAEKKGEPTALLGIKCTLFNFDDLLLGGKTLIITEGPFDALKLDFYAREMEVRATCLFNASASEEQLWLIRDLKDVFDDVIVLFDVGALFEAVDLSRKLSSMNIRVSNLQHSDASDPGSMSKDEVVNYCTYYASYLELR